MISPVYTQNAKVRYLYLPEKMKCVKFSKNGLVTEEVLEKGIHYVAVALNEVPLFIRSGKCIPLAKPAQTVEQLNTEELELIGFEGASYLLYEDDGVSKQYDDAGNYRELRK